jgi:hypothetical protein
MKISQAFIFLAWLLLIGVASTSAVPAADLRYARTHAVVTGSSAGYGGRHVYCPDRYACSSLYGAYGPYGGGAYWTRYTYGGWDYVR